MAMVAVLKRGAAILATWTDPYVAVDVRSTTGSAATGSTQAAPPGQRMALSLTQRMTARTLQLIVVEAGGPVEVGRRYREVAAARGLVRTWDEKIRANPRRADYLGASNFKLWSALDRSMDEASAVEKSVRVNWTFDEAAQVAEHLRRDLGLERVLFHMGGWIRRGYDNQHPDILPAAPECGGNDALADCARRVRELGYLFCLHDNYQDIYRDSPSWSEDLVNRNPDRSLTRGGVWAGGRAYITCARMALDLARRPGNLAAVRELTGAESYFIDTTYASGLYECHDPRHPMTRSDDLRWKVALSDYARSVFGSFGSECGREWAVPHADFFEGLTGVSGRGYHDAGLQKKLGAVIVPLFEVVYRDCIAAYGKYGYDPATAADYVLHHAAIGRPLHYHDVPSHLYWKESAGADRPRRQAPDPGASAGRDPGIFVHGDRGWTAGMHPLDRFVKNTHEILSPLHERTARLPVTAHEFLDPGRRVQRTLFGRGAKAYEVVVNAAETPLQRATRRGPVTLPPGGLLVDGPDYVAFLATAWGGRTFDSATLFTLRALDDRPLERSRRVRVFHGFGDPRIRFRGREHQIGREEVLVH